MNITEFSFFIFVGIAVLLYYLIPIKARWVVLLSANLYFLYNSNSWVLNGIWLGCALVTYGATVAIGSIREKKPKGAKAITVLAVLVVLGFMLALKDIGFFTALLNRALRLIGKGCPTPVFSAPIGISYYSLVWIGYILDVFWGTCTVEKNPFKFLAFCGYFPTYTSGPIAKYQDVHDSIVNGNKFSYKNLTFGAQRVVWGLMKKLIISERLAIVVNTIYEDTYRYPGVYVWIAMICFAFQLYTDFSGCIDIVIGIAEMFGIKLPENFDLPFMATSLAEFWRRWHITLGGWLRDYILYPILKSDLFQKIGAKSKKAFGKKIGKKVPTWIGLMISWFLIGFWHGGQWNYIIGVGIFFGVVIILSEMLEPAFNKLKAFLKINTEAASYRIFQRVRTFFIFMTGLSFFRSYDGFTYGVANWKNALTVYNPWVLFDGSLDKLGLDQHDIYILIFFGLLLAGSGLLVHFKKKSVREIIAGQNLVFRWILYLALIYAVIIFGCYGVEFDSASFIYQKF